VCALQPPPRARADDQEEFAIPLAPLIDIVFLLLVFFLMATTFMDEEKDLSLSLPRSSAGEGGERRLQRVLVNVRADGTLVVNKRTMDRKELFRALVEAREANPQIPVILRGDRAASHGQIVGVLSVCQRARVRNVAVAVEGAEQVIGGESPQSPGER
jgi:biopolymer transport protein ExbD